MQNSAIQGFNFFGRLIAFQGKQSIAGLHGVAILLEPTGEDTLFHGPAEPWDGDCTRHARHLVRVNSG
jgi:hypothetical protein